LLAAGETAHREFVKTLGPKALWLRFMETGPDPLPAPGE
jgi:hypothetical protein